MENNVVFSLESIQDLNNLHDYILLISEDKNTAYNFVNSIISSIDILKDNPECGKALVLQGVVTDFRYIVIKKYMIFYKYNHNKIIVSRIINSRRDYLSILFPDFQ